MRLVVGIFLSLFLIAPTQGAEPTSPSDSTHTNRVTAILQVPDAEWPPRFSAFDRAISKYDELALYALENRDALKALLTFYARGPDVPRDQTKRFLKIVFTASTLGKIKPDMRSLLDEALGWPYLFNDLVHAYAQYKNPNIQFLEGLDLVSGYHLVPEEIGEELGLKQTILPEALWLKIQGEWLALVDLGLLKGLFLHPDLSEGLSRAGAQFYFRHPELLNALDRPERRKISELLLNEVDRLIAIDLEFSDDQRSGQVLTRMKNALSLLRPAGIVLSYPDNFNNPPNLLEVRDYGPFLYYSKERLKRLLRLIDASKYGFYEEVIADIAFLFVRRRIVEFDSSDYEMLRRMKFERWVPTLVEGHAMEERDRRDFLARARRDVADYSQHPEWSDEFQRKIKKYMKLALHMRGNHGMAASTWMNSSPLVNELGWWINDLDGDPIGQKALREISMSEIYKDFLDEIRRRFNPEIKSSIDPHPSTPKASLVKKILRCVGLDRSN